jgi:hypothetical protein
VKAISEFVVHATDLLEAEGRALLTVVQGEARRARAVGLSLVVALAFLVVAIPLALAGLWLLGAGLMWWLESEVSRPLAAGLTGVATLSVAGVFLGCFLVLARKSVP